MKHMLTVSLLVAALCGSPVAHGTPAQSNPAEEAS
jgi:hypothetical protein